MSPPLSRRTALQLTAACASTSLAAPLLQACMPAPATAPATPAPGVASSSVYPTYLPATGGPKPQYPSTGPLYEDGFDTYPANPAKALPSQPPGRGGTANILSIGLFPPPTPFDQNPAWQAVNRQLNANVQFDIVTLADYPAKLATVMAGNDLPDAMYLWTGGTSPALAAAPGVPQFLQAHAADLTPYLAGDAARNYPYLAALPTASWKNAGCAVQGHLYTVPIHRYFANFVWLKNTTVYDTVLGADYVPKNADDFKRALQALCDPQRDFYAFGSNQGAALGVTSFSQLFGAPNNWRLESDGRLTKNWETPEFKEAVGYVLDLWKSGVFHPNSTTYTALNTRSAFAAGKFAMYLDAFGNGWQDGWRQALTNDPQAAVGMVPPFPAHDGGQPQHFTTGGFNGATLIKAASADRVQEMLRIFNWLAAPFGSAEDLLLTFGVKDTDYTIGPGGNPVLTERGNPDANYVPWKYVVQHPIVFFTPDLPNYAKVMSEAEHQLMPWAVADPTFGYVSATAFSKGVTLNQPVLDGLNDLVLGRRPLSDYDQVVRDWQTNGGEQMRQEYMRAIAAG